MSKVDEPPPLVDASSPEGADVTDVENERAGRGASLIEDDYGDEMWMDVNEENTETDEEDDEDEEEDDEDEDEDEEEEEEDYDSDDLDTGPDIPRNPFTYHPSEEGFQESDLEDRKKRRFVIGTHSFLDLADPHLETALDPEDEEDLENLTAEEKAKRGLKAEKSFYKDTCAELGVKPDPRVLASLRELEMDLTGMGMNAKEIIAVCKVLEKNTHVQFLSLAGNSACGEGGLAIAELIANNETITGYNLASTEILEVFDVICEALSQSKCIVYLNFSKNELEDIDMQHVKKVLFNSPVLTTLILNGNFIQDEGLRQLGIGLRDSPSLEKIDLSHNKIRGEKKAAVFFTSCAEHPTLKTMTLRRNFIGDEGGKGVARALGGNAKMEDLEVSFNLMEDGAATALGRSLGRQKQRDLKTLNLDLQHWRQESVAAILKPLGNKNNEMPIELLDFGVMLDVHSAFLGAKEKALKVHPDLKIMHGQTYGLDHAKGPDHRALVIRKADAVCKSFETPLVMLMEELAKEKKELTSKEFRKFIKQCNLYKDKTLTEAFEKVFEKKETGNVDAEAILEAFDKEYPGLRVIPEPKEEEEEPPKEEKKKKGKKGKKGKGKGKGKGKPKAKDKPASPKKPAKSKGKKK